MKYAYESKPVSDTTAELIKLIREMFSALDERVSDTPPQNPRYLALAKTHLEIASMFAIKSLTHTEVEKK